MRILVLGAIVLLFVSLTWAFNTDETPPSRSKCGPLIEIAEPGSCACGCYGEIVNVIPLPRDGDGCDPRMCDYAFRVEWDHFIAHDNAWRENTIALGGRVPCGYTSKIWFFCPRCQHYLTEISAVGCTE